MGRAIGVILVMCIAILPSCRKSPSALLEEEFELAQGAELNTQIRDLKEKLAEARDDSERALIHAKIALLQNAKGDIASSTASAREAVKFQPNLYMPHYLLGKSYLEAGRYDEAAASLQRSLELNEGYAPAWFETGNAYYKKGDYARAVRHYEKAVTLDKKHVMAHNNLGVLYNALGRKRDAEREFLSVVELRPDYAMAHKNLGILYDAYLKDARRAAASYRKYLELRPNCPERMHVQSWIRTLGG